MAADVHDNREASRYEVWADGELAGFTQYRLHDDRITFVHTQIDPAREGEGLGSQLARFALDDARSRGLMYIRRHHDEYLDAVLATWRRRVGAGAEQAG